MKFKSNIEIQAGLVDSNNSSGSAGQVLTSTGVGVDWIEPTLLPAESAEKVIQTVRFGEAVSKGDPLVITGYHGSNGPAIVERADATDATKMPAYGVALEDYAKNATGLMIAVGDFNDFDTSSYSIGDTLYVAVGGGMTNVKPTGTALIQNMGIVSRSNANNGDVEIVAIGRTNDVPNLPTGRLFVGTAANTSLVSDVVYVDDANDRVGIGTASPSTKLEVIDTFSVQRTSTPSAGLYVTVGGDWWNPTIQSFYQENNASNQGYRKIYDGDSNLYLEFIHDNDTVGTEVYRVNRTTKNTSILNGNLGIGIETPVNKLQIKQPTSYDGTRTTPGIRIKSDAESAIGNYHGTIALSSRGYGCVTISAVQELGDNDALGMAFFTHPSNVGTDISVEQMRIDRNGNVGIGATNPSDKLEVFGAQSITYDSTPNPDQGILKIQQDLDNYGGYDSSYGKGIQWGYKNGDPNMGPSDFTDMKIIAGQSIAGLIGSPMEFQVQEFNSFVPLSNPVSRIAIHPINPIIMTGGVSIGDNADSPPDAELHVRYNKTPEYYQDLVAKFEGLGAVQFPSMNTSDRDSINIDPGSVIWNQQEGKLQVFNGSSWENLH
jgi:hypothetical protein